MAPRKSRDTTPPPNPHHTHQQGPLQASGEATSAPPLSLATPAPGAGAPSVRKAKAVDKPAAASGSSGSNPTVGPSKDKQKAADKPTRWTQSRFRSNQEEDRKASAAANVSAEVERPTETSGGTPTPPAVNPAAPAAPHPASLSSLPDLRSVSNSSVSEEETTTAPLPPVQSESAARPAWFTAFLINCQMFVAEAHVANPEVSVTPSLASLLNPASSALGNLLAFPTSPGSKRSTSSAHPRGCGVLNMESVSHLFSSKVEDTRVFVSLCQDVKVFDEDVGSSLLKYHPVYNPNHDHDPLTAYGAVDGLLPGKNTEETIAF
ncbi:hypothetical protein B0H13DRAFT_1869328 [Mycena leptocephala]|nr:hypothetical protein B0H13DRAFT_1869328 [Mycena leptocephala]